MSWFKEKICLFELNLSGLFFLMFQQDDYRAKIISHILQMFLAELTTQGFVGVYEPKIEDITGPIEDKRRRRRRR